jgi:hypothetical protein
MLRLWVILLFAILMSIDLQTLKNETQGKNNQRSKNCIATHMNTFNVYFWTLANYALKFFNILRKHS